MASTPKEEFSYELRVPKERIAVLIGVKGQTKRIIERETQTKLEVDSEDGLVQVKGKDALLLYLAREIIRAIARGFNPEIALQLLKQDQAFELIQINTYARNPNDIERLRGRVIGEGGKSRRTIEDLTQTNICVFGKTIGIIGQAEYMADARKAIETLLSGSPHAHVYRWLERRRKNKKI